MIRRLTSALVAIALCTSLAYGQEIDKAKAAKHFADLMYADVDNNLAKQLEESGLAESDVDDIVNGVVDGYGKCVVDGFSASGDPLSLELLISLTAGDITTADDSGLKDYSPNELEEMFQNLREMIETCKYKVNQEYGIVDDEQ